MTRERQQFRGGGDLCDVASQPEALDRAADRGRSDLQLPAELGDVKVVAPKITERERERTEIRPALAAPVVLDLDGLAEEIEGRVSDMRGLLDGSPEQGREVARTLFAEERLRVYADDERGFRIEGSAAWALPSAVTVWCPGLESNQHSLARTRS